MTNQLKTYVSMIKDIVAIEDGINTTFKKVGVNFPKRQQDIFAMVLRKTAIELCEIARGNQACSLTLDSYCRVGAKSIVEKYFPEKAAMTLAGLKRC